jgi:hypothetical protein
MAKEPSRLGRIRRPSFVPVPSQRRSAVDELPTPDLTPRNASCVLFFSDDVSFDFACVCMSICVLFMVDILPHHAQKRLQH